MAKRVIARRLIEGYDLMGNGEVCLRCRAPLMIRGGGGDDNDDDGGGGGGSGRGRRRPACASCATRSALAGSNSRGKS